MDPFLSENSLVSVDGAVEAGDEVGGQAERRHGGHERYVEDGRRHLVGRNEDGTELRRHRLAGGVRHADVGLVHAHLKKNKK